MRPGATPDGAPPEESRRGIAAQRTDMEFSKINAWSDALRNAWVSTRRGYSTAVSNASLTPPCPGPSFPAARSGQSAKPQVRGTSRSLEESVATSPILADYPANPFTSPAATSIDPRMAANCSPPAREPLNLIYRSTQQPAASTPAWEGSTVRRRKQALQAVYHCLVDCWQAKEPIPDASFSGQCREGSLLDDPLQGRGVDTVSTKTNKGPGPSDSRRARVLAYLREWPARHGRTVHQQMLRGASYSLGSGAVSVLIVWWQNHH